MPSRPRTFTKRIPKSGILGKATPYRANAKLPYQAHLDNMNRGDAMTTKEVTRSLAGRKKHKLEQKRSGSLWDSIKAFVKRIKNSGESDEKRRLLFHDKQADKMKDDAREDLNKDFAAEHKINMQRERFKERRERVKQAERQKLDRRKH